MPTSDRGKDGRPQRSSPTEQPKKAVRANRFTPIDATQVPTGELRDVAERRSISAAQTRLESALTKIANS